SEMVALLAGGPSGSTVPEVFEIEPDIDDAPRFIVILKPTAYVEGYTGDDITGELNAFGLIERVIRPGATYSLEKHLLPGVGRALRRQMMSGVANNMPPSLTTGERIDVDDLQIRGPAVIIDVASIFT
ncbi:hypothetical protein ACL02T_21360, partial [Pseudonocardia sp. RS010]|uniref:hypothetical protein n=1 Tax=Pseudonocardia sp. RS010 TaxID=3385979 RepID=UPI0039A2D868